MSYETEGIAGCGADLELGVEYLFFLQESGEVGGCGGARRTVHADSEIASLRAFITAERAILVEPWSFFASEEGCVAGTQFDIGDDSPQGALIFDAWRPGRSSPPFGSAKLDVYLDGADGELTVTIAGTTYRPRVRTWYALAVMGDEAEELLRETLAAETLNLRVVDSSGAVTFDVDVSTANLVDTGNDVRMLECMGAPR